MNDRPRFRVIKHLAGLFLVGCLLIAACGWYLDRAFVEKLLTQLVLPCGLIWLALLVLTYVAFLSNRRWGTALLLLFLFYWVAGSGFTSDRFLSSLEGRFQHIDPRTEPPFDVLIVLGGGTLSNRNDEVWLSSKGERVMLAARLYQQGKVTRLISTGRLHEWVNTQSVDPADAAARIWIELGIPQQSIVQISGRNTAEEMERISRWLKEHPAERVGLLTSAFHLPRATRLARVQGLDVIPIPADFRIGLVPPWPLSAVPSSEGFLSTELCVREYLAYLVGR